MYFKLNLKLLKNRSLLNNLKPIYQIININMLSLAVKTKNNSWKKKVLFPNKFSYYCVPQKGL